MTKFPQTFHLQEVHMVTIVISKVSIFFCDGLSMLTQYPEEHTVLFYRYFHFGQVDINCPKTNKPLFVV